MLNKIHEENYEEAIKMFDYARKHESHVLTGRHYVLAINTYKKLNDYNRLKSFFEYLVSNELHDVRIINAMLAAYPYFKRFDESIALFNNLDAYGVKPDLITFEKIMYSFHVRGCHQDVIKVYDNALRKNIKPNSEILLYYLEACANLGNQVQIIETLDYIQACGDYPVENFLKVLFIFDRYYPENTWQLLSELTKTIPNIKNCISYYNIKILKSKSLEHSFKVLDDALKEGLTPNNTTYFSMLQLPNITSFDIMRIKDDYEKRAEKTPIFYEKLLEIAINRLNTPNNDLINSICKALEGFGDLTPVAIDSLIQFYKRSNNTVKLKEYQGIVLNSNEVFPVTTYYTLSLEAIRNNDSVGLYEIMEKKMKDKVFLFGDEYEHIFNYYIESSMLMPFCNLLNYIMENMISVKEHGHLKYVFKKIDPLLRSHFFENIFYIFKKHSFFYRTSEIWRGFIVSASQKNGTKELKEIFIAGLEFFEGNRLKTREICLTVIAVLRDKNEFKEVSNEIIDFFSNNNQFELNNILYSKVNKLIKLM